MSSTFDAFAVAEDVEEIAGEIYAAISERLPEGSVACGVFKKLHLEEIQHALRIRTLANQYRHAGRTFRALPADVEALTALREEMRDLLGRIVSASGPVDVASARGFARALETKLGAVHAERLAVNADPELQRFFAQLANEDREHARLLDSIPPPGF